MRYLEELIRYMKSKPGMWFATGEQIARYVKTAELRWLDAEGEGVSRGSRDRRSIRLRAAQFC